MGIVLNDNNKLRVSAMLFSQDEELILGRFVKVRVLKQTESKQIALLKNINDSEKCVAKIQPKAKLERINTRNVLNEASFMQVMQGHIGIPLMHWSGVNDPQILMIVEHLGDTVSEKLAKCGGRFSIKTTCLLGIQILKLLHNYHDKGLVHRNVHPRSFQFGRGIKSTTLYFNDLIDSKRYRNKKTYLHIASKDNIKYTFANQFSSRDFREGKEISRKDDIESLILMMGYLLTGVKPPKGPYSVDQYPIFIREMIHKIQTAGFYDEPDYAWYTQKLKSILFHEFQEEDGIYDWMLLSNRNRHRKIKSHIVDIKTEKDLQLTQQIYQPFQESIDIDELSTKHYNLIGINEVSAANRHNYPVQQPSPIPSKKMLKKKISMKQSRGECSLM